MIVSPCRLRIKLSGDLSTYDAKLKHVAAKRSTEFPDVQDGARLMFPGFYKNPKIPTKVCAPSRVAPHRANLEM